jgi:hypothetical protein
VRAGDDALRVALRTMALQFIALACRRPVVGLARGSLAPLATSRNTLAAPAARKAATCVAALWPSVPSQACNSEPVPGAWGVQERSGPSHSRAGRRSSTAHGMEGVADVLNLLNRAVMRAALNARAS